MKYREMYPDEERYGLAAVARTMFTGSVGSRQAQTILERIGESSATMAACDIRVLGGAMARVPADATAFAHRQSRIMINVAAIYDPSTSERSERAAWARGLSTQLDDSIPGAYAGFLADEGEERVRAAYPGATFERLAAVKATYDPDNVFRSIRNPARSVDRAHAAERHPAQPYRRADMTCSGRRRARRRAEATARRPAGD